MSAIGAKHTNSSTLRHTRSAANQRVAVASRVLQSVVTSLAAMVFALILVFVYNTFTVPVYGYMGYVWDPDYFTLVVGIIMVGLSAMYLQVRLARPADLFLYILFCFAYVPALVVPSTYSPLTRSDILGFQTTLLVCFLFLLVVSRLPLVRMDLALFTERGFAWFLLALAFVSMLPLVYYLGIPTALPGFGDVYKVRMESRESIAAAPFYIGYLYGFVTKVLSRFLIVYGVVVRRPSLVILGAGMSLYFYGLTGAKSLLFSILLLGLVFVGIWLVGRYLLQLILPAAVVLVIGARLADLTFMPNSWLSALMIDRIFIMPGVLTGYYHEYFTLNGFGKWGYSFLGWASDYPFSTTPPFIIGTEYFNNPATQANTHFWADGFANFGIGGMLFVTLVVGGVIWLINSLALGRSFLLVAAMSTVGLMSLVSDSIFTSLLTHGIGFICILIAISPMTNSGEKPNQPNSGIHEWKASG